jgi:CRISPR-associated endoribonuclease Cas6
VKNESLYSVVLELSQKGDATIPATMGHQIHALFINLVKRFDPVLASRLHDEPGYRPFTVSPLIGEASAGERIALRRGRTCHLRITLFDGGYIWHHLSTYILESGPVLLSLGSAQLGLVRMIVTQAADSTGWAASTTWNGLVTLPAQQMVTLRFVSPTAFSVGDRKFDLFPKPGLIWESLLRVWNAYAPGSLRMEKQEIREAVRKQITLVQCDIATRVMHYPKYMQKGFVGTCTYQVEQESVWTAQLTTLAGFAHFSGVGYKTTMGMGQVQVAFGPFAVKFP